MPDAGGESLSGTLAQITPFAFTFLLILTRVGGMVMLLPALGDSGVPGRMRVLLAASIAALLVPVVTPVLSADTYMLGFWALLGEVTIGLWMGWVVRTFASVMSVAAQYMSHVLGLSTALVPDNGGQAGVLVKALELSVPVIFLGTDLYQFPLQALAASYEVLQPAQFQIFDGIYTGTVRIISRGAEAALQIAAPFLVAAFVWSLASGLIARMIPRLQIYFVLMPLQTVLGLLLLATVMTGTTASWHAHWAHFAVTFAGMRPW